MTYNETRVIPLKLFLFEDPDIRISLARLALHLRTTAFTVQTNHSVTNCITVAQKWTDFWSDAINGNRTRVSSKQTRKMSTLFTGSE
jgi:hypothetical protein